MSSFYRVVPQIQIMKFIEQNFPEFSRDPEFSKEFRDSLKLVNSSFYTRFTDIQPELLLLDIISHSWVFKELEKTNCTIVCTRCNAIMDTIPMRSDQSMLDLSLLHSLAMKYRYVENCSDFLVKDVLSQ